MGPALEILCLPYYVLEKDFQVWGTWELCLEGRVAVQLQAQYRSLASCSRGLGAVHKQLCAVTRHGTEEL